MAELVTNTEPEQQLDPNDINLSLEELRNKYSATIMAQKKKIIMIHRNIQVIKF